MKKTLLLLALGILSVPNCLAQDKGYFAVSLGAGMPIGAFASKDTQQDDSGLALAGLNYDISFAYKLGKHFGVAATLRGQSNTIAENILANQIIAQVPAGVKVAVDSGNWTANGLLAGGYGSFSLTNKVSFETRLLLGFVSASSPSLDIRLNNGLSQGWVKQESGKATAFAHLVGIGVKFDASKRVCLLAHVDYMGAKPDFKNVETTGSDGSLQTSSWSQPINTIGVGVGIGYRI